MTHITSKTYADNWFQIGFKPRERKGEAEHEYDRAYNQSVDSYSTRELTYRGVKYYKHNIYDQEAARSFSIYSSPKLSHAPKRYGSGGISANGKRTVKGASALLQEAFGRERLGFCTVTLPNLPSPMLDKIAENWGEVVRVFYQRVKRYFNSKGFPFLYVSVTEIQSDRYKETGDVCPHLHFAYVSKSSRSFSPFIMSADMMRLVWGQTIRHQCNKHFGYIPSKVEWKACVDMKPVKKSVSSYLGKYMSKGGAIVDEICEDGRAELLPKQWWTMPRLVKLAYKNTICALAEDYAWFIFQNPDRAVECGLIRYYKEIWIQTEDGDRRVGMCGYFNASMQRELACVDTRARNAYIADMRSWLTNGVFS